MLSLKALGGIFKMEFYKPRKIASIEKDDNKFCLLGVVEETGEGYFILSDETGKVKVNSNFKVNKGMLVKVFCSKLDEEIFADFIQNKEGLDLNLWKKAESLYLRLI
jgi:hypothetical protein